MNESSIYCIRPWVPESSSRGERRVPALSSLYGVRVARNSGWSCPCKTQFPHPESDRSGVFFSIT